MIKIEIIKDATSENLGSYYVAPEVAQKMLSETLEFPFEFNGLVDRDSNEYHRLLVDENTVFKLQRV